MIDSIQEYLEKRFFFGFKISQLEEVGSDLHLYLEAISPGMCQQCKCRQTNIHDYYPREISELPILGKNVIVHLKVRRVICQHCGFKGVEFIRWLSKSKYAHTTQRKNDAVIED
ncbi:zinc-finger of transposase IS204/IS1001/IS1096/IS1165, partial [Succinivibrio dextrinosolvens DSM 3072]